MKPYSPAHTYPRAAARLAPGDRTVGHQALREVISTRRSSTGKVIVRWHEPLAARPFYSRTYRPDATFQSPTPMG